MTQVQMENDGNGVGRTLPFNSRKQDAVLGHLLTNASFFLQARTLIKPEWFSDPHAGEVYRAKLKFFDQYDRSPTVDELREYKEIAYEEKAKQAKLLAKINCSTKEIQNYGLDVVQRELTDWLRTRLFLGGLNEARNFFNKEKYDNAYQVVNDTLNQIREASFEKDFEVSFENPAAHIEAELLDRSGALTFGHPVLDNLLLPGNPTGSLLPGDTTVALAPTNVGKTTNLITVAVANVKRQKHVLFLSHEGRWQDLMNKMYCAFLRVDMPGLIALCADPDPEAQKRLRTCVAYFKEYLTYIPYNKAGMMVEDVESIIRRRQERHIAKYGKPFDMIVDDYPAKLSTMRAVSGRLQGREIALIVYDYFVQLGLEYGTHMLLAIQSNREGARVNKQQRDSERRLLVMEDVHEAYGPMQLATNVITLNRDPAAKARQRITFYIDKSRSSETGWAVVCKTNYAHSLTHHKDLPATYYRGTSTMADTIDDLLAQYPNVEIPFDKAQ